MKDRAAGRVDRPRPKPLGFVEQKALKRSSCAAGRPRGRPSLDELLLEEAARLVKFQAGDKVMHMDRDRALMRKLFDIALQGNLRAIQLVTERLRQAQAALAAKADPETPLTEEEIALLEMMSKTSGG